MGLLKAYASNPGRFSKEALSVRAGRASFIELSQNLTFLDNRLSFALSLWTSTSGGVCGDNGANKK